MERERNREYERWSGEPEKNTKCTKREEWKEIKNIKREATDRERDRKRK